MDGVKIGADAAERKPAEEIGVPARRAALGLLDAVLRRGLPLDGTSGGAGLAPADRAFALAIAGEALRWLAELDALIDTATARSLPPDAKARAVLRIALAQALAMGVAPHAAIATALPLVEGGPKRLVHGVFGTLMRGHAKLPEAPRLPAPVAESWAAAWGEAAVLEAGRALAHPPPLDLTLRDPGETEAWAERLGGVSLLPGHVRLPRGRAVRDLAGYAEGGWWVQDVAASLPARLLGSGPGPNADRALDLCAAPGGKTMQLAAAGWRVTALDSSATRLARVSENLERNGLAARTIAADMLWWQPDAPADAVLLDAPCTATGIFRRHPDVLHRVRPALIADRAALQAALLARAAGWVKPGGLLVYAVCSLEREEGEAIVAAFLAGAGAGGFAIDPVRPDELPAGIAPTADGHVRVPPGALIAAGGADGFFAARLRRAI